MLSRHKEELLMSNLVNERGLTGNKNYWKVVVGLFFLGWVLMYATRTIFNPIMGVVGQEFGLSNTQLGIANSIFFLTYSAVQIPFGLVGDKYGRKLVIVVGFILMGIMTYVSGLATTFTAFLIIRAIAGLAQGTFYGPQWALTAEAIPSSKRTVGNALINSGMAFGTSGGYLLSSQMVLENGNRWSAPFFVMAIPTVILGIIFIFFLKEKAPQSLTTEIVAETSAPKIPIMESLGKIFKNKNLVASYIMLFASIYANFVVITWLPQFLITERGFEGTSVGFISSLVPWASIPGALIFARINDKYKQTKKLVYILVPLAMLFVCLIAFVPNKTLLIVVLILSGLTGKLALDPILITFVTHNAPKNLMSTSLSAFAFSGMCGSILAPYVTGYITDQFGSMKLGFYMAAVLLGIALIFFAVLADDTVDQENVSNP